MATSYSTSLRLSLMGNGDQSGTWGTTTNTNWNMIEQAVAGVQSIVMGNTNYTLANLNGVQSEAHNMVLVVQGSNSAIYQVIAPLAPKFYVVSNQTSGGFAITIGGSSGSVITIPNGTTAQVYSDGVNFYAAQTTSTGNFLVNGNLTVSGTTAYQGAITGTTATFSGALAAGSFTGPFNGSTGTFSGIVTAASFTGAGTGLTGTAASLSIGGNAATSTTTAQTNFATLTVQNNTVLTSNNFNGYAPSLTGNGASGNWGINITGNAATVTNGVYNNGGSYNIIAANASQLTSPDGTYTFSLNSLGFSTFYVSGVAKWSVDVLGYANLYGCNVSTTMQTQQLIVAGPSAVFTSLNTGSFNALSINTGNNTMVRTASSLRYKHDIHDTDIGLAEVLKLRPVTFRFNDFPDTIRGGFIAEEVEELGLTEFVNYDPEGRPEGLSYDSMVSLMTKAIQELNDKIENLQSQLDEKV